MTAPWWVVVGLVALGLGGGAWAVKAHDAEVARTARFQQWLKADDSTIATLEARDAKAAKVLHVDTVRVEYWRPIYKVAHDTVLKNVHDTIAVIRFVQIADSTIKVCSQLVTDCQARVRIIAAQFAACTDEVGLWKKQAPNIWQRHEVAVVVTTDVLAAILGAFVAKKF